jgi:dephospho-CoA kinase
MAMDRSDLAIAFSGQIGSGKTSLSLAVADALQCPRVSFGLQVREEARHRGLDDSRETLQRLGETLILNHKESFCRSVISQARPNSHAPLLIDGVRHIEVLELLRNLLAPRRLVLVHIALDQEVRSTRLAGDASAWDSHSTELQVPIALQAHADLILDGTHALATLCLNVVRWIEALPT